MKLDALRKRAELLDRLRAFFRERGFLEVETPVAAREVIPEQHIEPIMLADEERFLQASPEMHHKRLLCVGSGPVFEVTRSFRGREWGKLHNPEFTIVEWYRPGDDLHAGMDLLDELVQTLLDAPPARRTTYREAFARALGLDPHVAPVEGLREAGRERAPELPDTGQASSDIDFDNRDDWLNYLLSLYVEPTLGEQQPELLYHYPASQAALARLSEEQGDPVAERFELYYRGVELANGYHELTDANELRQRLTDVNTAREAGGRLALPMPERLLEAMTDPGLPPCAGVAFGFDRLVMLATGAKSIGEVTAFSEF